MQQIHTGKCPIVNEERSITVNYIFVPILGTTTRNYKKSIAISTLYPSFLLQQLVHLDLLFLEIFTLKCYCFYVALHLYIGARLY